MNENNLKKELLYYEIDLESLLFSLENGNNPNCYDETGTIRSKFMSSGRSTIRLESSPHKPAGVPIVKRVTKVEESL